ncbi:Transcription initiation factor TFIID subunit 7 [Intoshia linei]|uniref:Transcription initiation factor TFIID subunit 7 n=1 Tax=Intoshia linei TaxID=1819745 RepID=A0A177B2M2_9BILA|nr:Transcription initiation factor TFIID subunit 7 [Intoshia linei]
MADIENKHPSKIIKTKPLKEELFILRLPEKQADEVIELLQKGDNAFKDNLRIQLNQNKRTGSVEWKGTELKAKIVDLPCINEVMKTIDKKNLYKTGVVSQMLICDEVNFKLSETPEINTKMNDVDVRYLWDDGLTPPMKCVRKRNFREILINKDSEESKLHEEVRNLLRADEEAVSIRYEIVDESAPNIMKPVYDSDEERETKRKHEELALELLGEISSTESESTIEELMSYAQSNASDDDLKKSNVSESKDTFNFEDVMDQFEISKKDDQTESKEDADELVLQLLGEISSSEDET